MISGDFAQRYPHIHAFVDEHGWVEVGYDDFSASFIRALDIGGLIWEGKQAYDSLDAAFADLEQALAIWDTGDLDMDEG